VSELAKIISGGQTGVDQAALRAAQRCGIPCGGWCPPGRESEDGQIPATFPLKETPEERSPSAPNVPRSLRTEWNVRDSDATLILRPSTHDLTDPGTDWTATCAVRYGRPFLVCDPRDQQSETKIVQWLHALPIQTLNVGGPSEKTFPGIGDDSYALLVRVLGALWRRGDVQPHPTGDASHTDTVHHDPLPWWLGVPLRVARWIGQGRILAVAALAAIVPLVIIFVGVKLLGFRIEAGQIYLGSTSPELGAHVTVDATAGFQEYGIHVTKGEQFIIIPEGRIHVAMDHANNLARAVKGIIVHKTPGRFGPEIMKRYAMPALDESAVFYRDWAGPEGDPVPSDILEDCKLRKELGWGALLAVVLPYEVSARSDPYEVLKSAGLTPLDFTPIPSRTVYTAPRDGWLTFIVNEAVISPLSPSTDSRLFYDTLKSTAETLEGDPRHRIPLDSIPLLWFADNNGAFRVQVLYKTD
jgi:Circularly permutated YpsA SLOG family